MKKIVLIVGTVAALIALTFYADRATRLSTKASGSARPAAKAEGKPAPEVKLKDLNDKDVALADLKGKVVFVNFWATWCDPCRIEIPWLIDMQAKYADKGFTVVGVAMDEEGKSVVAPFVSKERFDVNGQQLPMSYPIWLGSDEAGEKFGGILGYPTSFLISRDGKVVTKFQGLKSQDELIKAIESQL
jgi:cytochrome c biogenesis protein CcmG/thiol:disulfide interchange protein DsbE